MKYMGMVLMSIMSLALMVGAVVYLSNRFALYFPISPNKRWLWIFGFTMFLMMLGQGFSITPNAAGRVFSMASSIGMAIILYLLLSVIVFELIHLVVNISPSLRGILSLGLMCIILFYGIFISTRITVKKIKIPIEGLTKEIKAIHLTDIHLGNFRGEGFLTKIVDKIEELQPDVVFNTGDLFDSKAHFNNSSQVLKPFLRLKIPQYFVYGNHDVYVGIDEVCKQVKQVNAIVLQNEIAYFRELQIVGLNNMLKDPNTFDVHATPGAETIKSVMNKLPINKSLPTLVLHHRPDGIEYMDAKNVDLLLCGHTHAGQMWPITYISNLMFKYNRGIYTFNNMAIYVSEGLGTLFAPLRIGTNSEIALIQFVPKNK
jgi:predicted MPP superfamily phosphohydrolase